MLARPSEAWMPTSSLRLWTTHMDVGSFPKRRECEGMYLRRVSQVSPWLQPRLLHKRTFSLSHQPLSGRLAPRPER